MFWSSGSKTSESGTGEDMLRSSSSFKGGPPGAGEVVELNVGGTVHAVSKATLLKVQGTLFTDLTKGKAKAAQDKDDRIFIDRSGSLFEHVLAILRNSGSWRAPDNVDLCCAIADECEYYGIYVPQLRPYSLPTGTQIFAIGGSADTERPFNTIYNWDSEEATWGKQRAMAKDRQWMGTAVVENSIVVVGGATDIQAKKLTDAVDRYDIRLNRWQPLSSLCTPRAKHAVTEAQGRVYALGGCINLQPSFDGVEVFDMGRDRWYEAAQLPKPADNLAACSWDGCVYVSGGYNKSDKCLDMFAMLDPRQGDWQLLPALPEARAAHASVAVDGQVYVIGGMNRKEKLVPEVYSYDIKAGAWQACTSMAMPRKWCAATAAGKDVYVIGGYGSDDTDCGLVDVWSCDKKEWSKVDALPFDCSCLSAVAYVP